MLWKKGVPFAATYLSSARWFVSCAILAGRLTDLKPLDMKQLMMMMMKMMIVDEKDVVVVVEEGAEEGKMGRIIG